MSSPDFSMYTCDSTQVLATLPLLFREHYIMEDITGSVYKPIFMSVYSA